MIDRIIKTYNRYHLGDSIFNCILFYNITDYIEKNDIIIEYHCHSEYHKQISEFIISKNIILKDFNEKNDMGTDLWMHSSDYQNMEASISLDEYLLNMFNQFLIKNDIPIKIEKLEYTDPDLLIRYDTIKNKYGDKYTNLDFLIFNSRPRSGQYNYNENQWNSFIHDMNKKYKIAMTTTEPIDGVSCTMDDGLSVKDIAAITTHTKQIIGVNSGVMTVIFNTYTLNNVEKVYYFNNSPNTYSLNKFILKDNIDDMRFLLEDSDSVFPQNSSVENFDSHENYVSSKNMYVITVVILLLLWFVYNFVITKRYPRLVRRQSKK